jgi:hypothetical protein
VCRVSGRASDRALVVDDTNRYAAPPEASDYGEAAEVASEDHRSGRRLAHSSIARVFIHPFDGVLCLPAPFALIYDAI